MTSAPPPFGWLDGSVVPWDRCVLHARTQGAFWGATVFEGLRAYRTGTDGGLSLFRVGDHLARLRRSTKCLRMTLPYSDDEITAACLELVRANDFSEDVHVTIAGYFGMGENFDPMCHTDEAGMHITAVPAPPSAGKRKGVSACVSSWRRIGDDTMPPRIKTGANYHNSRLAHHEALRDGYQAGLLLNQRGTVAEAPGSCLVMVRDGGLVTPPGTSGVLEGITLASVCELAAELDIPTERREIDRTELYVADEAFLCGTIAEIQPILSLDRLPLGDGTAGPITRRLQELYERAVRGHPDYRRWATPVPGRQKAGV